jgi:catechol 2,3-dioxygenase-like lactoylglutathione lyase family enzyme
MLIPKAPEAVYVRNWFKEKTVSVRREKVKPGRKIPYRRKQSDTDPWMILALPQVRQIGIVVEDVPKTARFYSKVYGIGPWFRSKFTDEQHYLSGKRPIHFDLDIALAFAGKVQYEIIEHKGGDRSIYVDHLEKHGEGVHHLGFYVDDFDKSLASCRNCGIRVLQWGVLKSSGNLGGSTTKYAYLDTRRTGGVIFELIETRAMGMKIKPSRSWFELGAAVGDLEKMRIEPAARDAKGVETLSDFHKFCFRRWSGLSQSD